MKVGARRDQVERRWSKGGAALLAFDAATVVRLTFALRALCAVNGLATPGGAPGTPWCEFREIAEKCQPSAGLIQDFPCCATAPASGAAGTEIVPVRGVESRALDMLPKKRAVVLLRWVLIIAFSYLLLLDASTGTPRPGVVLLIAFALASNLVVARMPVAWLETRVFDFGVVLLDAGWVTLGLLLAPNVSGDLFLLYFLVIFIASMGESLPMIVGSAVLVSLVYGASLSYQSGENFRLTTSALLRVPFLFVVALFYGYFVTEIRGRRSEALEARLREEAKSELLAAVSHDLRGPLGNAESLLALVLEGDPQDSATHRVLLLRAQVNVRRVSLLVVNLLQAACIKAGQVRLQVAPMQLNDVVEDVVNLEAGAALLKEITLTKSLHADLPVISADLMQVGRIVNNLISNAIKYTSIGGSVSVRTSCDDEVVRLSVRDNGPGMSSEQCQELFAPYRRVHLGGAQPGTGLGLYIVKCLTEAQGGTVAVSSQLGVGSTFTATFPVARPQAEHTTATPRRPDVAAVSADRPAPVVATAA